MSSIHSNKKTSSSPGMTIKTEKDSSVIVYSTYVHLYASKPTTTPGSAKKVSIFVHVCVKSLLVLDYCRTNKSARFVFPFFGC